MTLSPEILERIRLIAEGVYNGRRFDVATNPLGIAEGGNVRNAVNPDGNFVALARDVVAVSTAMVGELYAGLAKMEELADRQAIAAHMINQVPGVTSFNKQTGDVVFDLPRVYTPGNQSPAPGAVAVLSGGALTLAVVAYNSLGGFTQKSRQALISEQEDFSTIAWDSGTVAGAQLTVTLENAQATLTGGKTYYWKMRQTAAITGEPDFNSLYSAPTTFVFPRAPGVSVMTAPENGATNQGAQNRPIAFAASDYAHPNNVARASRVFEISTSPTFAAIVTRVASASGSSVASLAAPRDLLQPDTLYYVRCRDTDENGGTNTSAVTTFRTVNAFRPNLGDPYLGGFYAGQINDEGTIYDLIVAPKASGEVLGVQWSSATPNSNPSGASSDTNGSVNTSNAWERSAQNNPVNAIGFCQTLVLNGYDDWYLPSRREIEIAYFNLKPTTEPNSVGSGYGPNPSAVPARNNDYTAATPAQTTVAAFRTGGSEAFADSSSTLYHSSTEASGSANYYKRFTEGAAGLTSKTSGRAARAFRRVPA